MIRCLFLIVLVTGSGCAAGPSPPPFAVEALGGRTLWVPAVRNTTDADLRLPASNPLRSLAELAGKLSPDQRPSVTDLLRASIKQELEQRKISARFPEEHDPRLGVLPLGAEAAARVARSGALEGALFLSEIRRWEFDAPDLMRLWVEFKLVRIADGATLWQRTVQKVIPVIRPGNVAEIYNDAVRAVVRDLF